MNAAFTESSASGSRRESGRTRDKRRRDAPIAADAADAPETAPDAGLTLLAPHLPALMAYYLESEFLPRNLDVPVRVQARALAESFTENVGAVLRDTRPKHAQRVLDAQSLVGVTMHAVTLNRAAARRVGHVVGRELVPGFEEWAALGEVPEEDHEAALEAAETRQRMRREEKEMERDGGRGLERERGMERQREKGKGKEREVYEEKAPPRATYRERRRKEKQRQREDEQDEPESVTNSPRKKKQKHTAHDESPARAPHQSTGPSWATDRTARTEPYSATPLLSRHGPASQASPATSLATPSTLDTPSRAVAAAAPRSPAVTSAMRTSSSGVSRGRLPSNVGAAGATVATSISQASASRTQSTPQASTSGTPSTSKTQSAPQASTSRTKATPQASTSRTQSTLQASTSRTLSTSQTTSPTQSTAQASTSRTQSTPQAAAFKKSRRSAVRDHVAFANTDSESEATATTTASQPALSLSARVAALKEAASSETSVNAHPADEQTESESSSIASLSDPGSPAGSALPSDSTSLATDRNNTGRKNLRGKEYANGLVQVNYDHKRNVAIVEDPSTLPMKIGFDWEEILTPEQIEKKKQEEFEANSIVLNSGRVVRARKNRMSDVTRNEPPPNRPLRNRARTSAPAALEPPAQSPDTDD